jgi:hypothetical protein
VPREPFPGWSWSRVAFLAIGLVLVAIGLVLVL